MMTQKDLFEKALMVEKPWYVHKIKFDQQAGKFEIWIDFERGSTFYYRDQESGIEGHFKAYDTTRKTWRHLNFFQYQCYLHAWIPRVDLGDGKVRQVQAPWEGHTAGFTLLFEALDLTEHKGSPDHIVQVSCDMFPAFIKGVENTLPDTAIVFDRFHVTKVINEAVDKVRKAEVAQNPILRNYRYLFLKNRDNLTIN